MTAALPAQDVGRELWLDGLRGFAALVVAIFHATTVRMKMPYRSFWDEPAQENRHLIQLAPFRVLFAGQAMVDIFFVISGYSISIAIIKHRNRGATADFYRRLSSATLRRFFRLGFPVLVMSAVSHLVYYFGLYAWLYTAEDGFPGCVPLSNPLPHIKWFLDDNMDILNLNATQDTSLNDHLWTIPIEIQGSLLIWLTTMGLTTVRHSLRIAIITFIGFRFLWLGNPMFAAFYAGHALAELDAHARFPTLPLLVDVEKKSYGKPTWLSRLAMVAKWVVLATGFYLVCLPAKDPFTADWWFTEYIGSPHWAWWEVKKRSWHTIGAILFISTLRLTPALKKPFESRLGQFLGNISFSLYLVHQTFYRTLLPWVLNAVSEVIIGESFGPIESGEREDSGWVFGWAWIVAALVVGPALLITSNYMAKAVDHRGVVLAHRIEKMLSN